MKTAKEICEEIKNKTAIDKEKLITGTLGFIEAEVLRFSGTYNINAHANIAMWSGNDTYQRGWLEQNVTNNPEIVDRLRDLGFKVEIGNETVVVRYDNIYNYKSVDEIKLFGFTIRKADVIPVNNSHKIDPVYATFNTYKISACCGEE